MSTTNNRNKGLTSMSSNFQVKIEGALDPRVAVTHKSELISKETWPYDGDTIYLYDGLLVSVKNDKAIYMLVDKSNALKDDYSGWHKIGSGGGSGGGSVEVIDNLTSTDVDKALSANQGRVLLGEIKTVEAKISYIYSFKGVKETVESLPSTANNGDVWMVNGVSHVWNGLKWVELTNFIDLSSYYTKAEVDALIQGESDRAQAAEEALLKQIGTHESQIIEIRNSSAANTTNLATVGVSIQEINSTLTEVQKDIEDLKENGGGGGSGTIDPEISAKVEANAQAITSLNNRVGDANSGLIKDMNTLKGDAETDGSIDYKIAKAFEWVTVNDKQ